MVRLGFFLCSWCLIEERIDAMFSYCRGLAFELLEEAAGASLTIPLF
jgi:hypothetical protein